MNDNISINYEAEKESININYLITLEKVIKLNLDPFNKTDDTLELLNDLYKITHLIQKKCSC